MTHRVYVITNTINGKRYIGKKISELTKAKISAKVKATFAANPIVVTDETRKHMIDASAKRFAHIVPLHSRVVELRNTGLKHSEVAAIIKKEFGVDRCQKHYAVIFSDHKLNRCKTCFKINAAVVGRIVVME